MSSQLIFYIVFSVLFRRGLGTVNFALHKFAVQSTTIHWKNFDWTADKAVDGNSDGSYPDTSMTCSSTMNTGNNPVNQSWEVDLGPPIIVKTITVYGRTDGPDHLYGVNLFIGNEPNPWIYNQALPSILSRKEKYVFKPNDAIASVISLRRLSSILVLCEVTVEGECLDGNFSEFCNLTCGKCYAGQPCNKENGTCPLGCDQGLKGTLCKEGCERGKYGYNCNETCGNCLYGNNNCSPIDGNCTNGCIAGWQDNDCKRGCVSGKYGYNCNETCGNCLYGITSCNTSYGHCNNGCKAGWQKDDCKKECNAGTFGFTCNETCGYCLNGNNYCSHMNGQCSGGCQAGWTGATCKSECEVGTYGFNCKETCGYCLNGNNSCSKNIGQCSGGCQSGWNGETCKSDMLETVTPGDVGPYTGVIIGSVLAAVGVSISAMVIIIVIVKKRKRNNNEKGTENVTPFTNYANLVAGNPDAAIKITVPSREERETAFYAIEDTNMQNGMPIGVTNSHSGVMEADVLVHNIYEKLRKVPESTESAYSTIDQNLTHDQKMNTIENGSNYIETLQELECALKSIEEEIGVLLDRKGKLLCKELERSRAIKFRDKRKETDSSQSDTNKDYIYVNIESKDALERCGNFVEMLQSLEVELRLLEEKRKCLFERKETLLSKNLRKPLKYEK